MNNMTSPTASVVDVTNSYQRKHQPKTQQQQQRCRNILRLSTLPFLLLPLLFFHHYEYQYSPSSYNSIGIGVNGFTINSQSKSTFRYQQQSSVVSSSYSASLLIDKNVDLKPSSLLTLSSKIDDDDDDNDSNDDNDNDDNDNDNDNDEDSNFMNNADPETLRNILEASWNTASSPVSSSSSSSSSITINAVPISMDVAASDAASCVLNASSSSSTESSSKGWSGLGGSSIHIIELSFPPYDPTFATTSTTTNANTLSSSSSSSMYDELSLVEFGTQFADNLYEMSNSKYRTLVLTRDDVTLERMKKILEVRAQSKAQNSNDDDSDSDDDDDPTEDPAEAMRRQLAEVWDVTEGDSDDGEFNNNDITDTSSSSPTTTSYRLASLLGDPSCISNGPDMMEDVVSAVRGNALPKSDQENVICILGPYSTKELVALRLLAGKYGNGKSDVIMTVINPRFPSSVPVPKEVAAASVTYSIKPLVARLKGGRGGGDNSGGEDKDPRIVVLRRYPTDWEVWVDPRDGDDSSYNAKENTKQDKQGTFERIATYPASLGGQNGPPMDWLQDNIGRYMVSKFGR